MRVRALLNTLNNIKLTASKLECLELDLQEFAYLRLFSLFRFSKSFYECSVLSLNSLCTANLFTLYIKYSDRFLI